MAAVLGLALASAASAQQRPAPATPTSPGQGGADIPVVAATGRDYQDCAGRDLEAKVRGCTRILEDPNTDQRTRTDTLWRRASAYRQLGRPDPAIADYSEYLKAHPRSASAYLERGISYSNKNDHDKALADYEQVIRLEPNNTWAYNNSGVVRNKQKRWDEAIAAFDKAIELDPLNLLAYKNRAESYEAKGEIEKAIAGFKHVLDTPERPGHRDDLRAKGMAQTNYDRLTSTAKPAARRVALVIGNSAYAHVASLPNPVNDAKALAQSLRKLGFAEVIEKTDMTRAELAAELQRFGDKAETADWAVIYYAGHGIEINSVNYVIPVDAKLVKAAHVEDEALPLDRVISKVEGAKKLRLVILDACRNNPFTARMQRDGRTRSVGQGLARIEPLGGTMIAYAARDGTVAQDGDGRHSPYAEALLKHMGEPGLDIRFLFDKVRDTVLTATRNQQMPFTYGSLPAEQFVFRPR
jgi:tetratricopeptide (TPR) repeat protein